MIIAMKSVAATDILIWTSHNPITLVLPFSPVTKEEIEAQ